MKERDGGVFMLEFGTSVQKRRRKPNAFYSSSLREGYPAVPKHCPGFMLSAPPSCAFDNSHGNDDTPGVCHAGGRVRRRRGDGRHARAGLAGESLRRHGADRRRHDCQRRWCARGRRRAPGAANACSSSARACAACRPPTNSANSATPAKSSKPVRAPGGRCWTVRGGTRETEIGGPEQTARFSGGRVHERRPGAHPGPPHDARSGTARNSACPSRCSTTSTRARITSSRAPARPDARGARRPARLRGRTARQGRQPRRARPPAEPRRQGSAHRISARRRRPQPRPRLQTLQRAGPLAQPHLGKPRLRLRRPARRRGASRAS